MESNLMKRIARSASRHPQRTIQIGLLTSMVAARGKHVHGYYQAAAGPIKRAASDQRVHRESQKAAAEIARAIRRTGQVGITEATTDRCVARGLRRSRRHAAKALALTVAPRRSHRKRNATIVAVGVGATTAALAAKRGQSAFHTVPPSPPDVPVGSTGAGAPDTP